MVQHLSRIFEGNHVERNHRSEAALLADCDTVVRMRRQSGVMDALHAGMILKEARDHASIRIVLFHAHGQRLDPPRHEKAVHRSEACARRALQEIDFLRIGRTRQNNRPSERIAMPVQVFRHRVDDDLRSERNRGLQVRTQKRVVRDQSGALRRGNLRHGGNVSNAHRWVGRRLDVDHLGVRLD